MSPLFEATKSLTVSGFDDFTRLHDISEITSAKNLEELDFGDKVWSKYTLNSLKPLSKCKRLKHLNFTAKKILDERIEPLSEIQNLERLSFPSHLFTTEQVAWLKAKLPVKLESKVLAPLWKIEKPIEMKGKKLITFIVGKRKPMLDSEIDKVRIDKYILEFEKRVQWFTQHPTKKPDDYIP